jgi:hypothetical protein
MLSGSGSGSVGVMWVEACPRCRRASLRSRTGRTRGRRRGRSAGRGDPGSSRSFGGSGEETHRPVSDGISTVGPSATNREQRPYNGIPSRGTSNRKQAGAWPMRSCPASSSATTSGSRWRRPIRPDLAVLARWPDGCGGLLLPLPAPGRPRCHGLRARRLSRRAAEMSDDIASISAPPTILPLPRSGKRRPASDHPWRC